MFRGAFTSIPCLRFHGKESNFRLKRITSLFVRVISHQPAVLFSQNKPTTSNQPTVLFSHSKSAPAISHQPNEQAAHCRSKKCREICYPTSLARVGDAVDAGQPARGRSGAQQQEVDISLLPDTTTQGRSSSTP
jgi:hypothetical protein